MKSLDTYSKKTPPVPSGWSDELTYFHEETAGDNHFIDRASRRHALEQLGRVRGETLSFLDVGCSSGFMLRSLQDQIPQALVIGSDFVMGPLRRLRTKQSEIPLLQSDLTHCALAEASVDAVILLNVLEHIEDDATAIRQVYRILKPGGIAIIEVPANQNLYDVYDQLLMHHRRYSLAGLRQIARDAGFQIIKQSHLGFFLYPGFWLTKQRNKRLLQDQSNHQQVVTQNIRTTRDNRLFDTLMRIELVLGKWVSYPYGIRCLLTCTKKP